jgi:signal transduction histidine kinase
MAREQFRVCWRFAGPTVSVPAIFVASPALAQGFSTSLVMGAMPLAVSLGAGGFALLAMALLRRLVKDAKAAKQQAQRQIASLRALVDEYEALLSNVPEITVLWSENAEGPKFLGQSTVILPPGRRPDAVLDFASWLPEDEAEKLARALEGLKVYGNSFDQRLQTLDGRQMRATGWVLGGGSVLRLRPAYVPQPLAMEAFPPAAEEAPASTELEIARAVLGGLGKPAFLRDHTGKLTFVNAPYLALAEALGRVGLAGQPPELLDAARRLPAEPRREGETGPWTRAVTLAEDQSFELIEYPVASGTAGYLRPQPSGAAKDSSLNHLSGIIDTLATPIAIFNAKRGLVQYNSAYLKLWGLDAGWLRLGMDERAILDKLRTEGVLPNEADYHAWRGKHLTSYQLDAPRESEPWHLPDGRTIQVIAAPAGPNGGVIYVFEDITDQLKLRSQHKALLNVQRSTLNALSEGVAVFGTNGRLTLCNPRLSTLWKLPTNLLEQNPHIDQVAEAVAAALPEDGAAIWRNLKRGIIDLNPNRTDTSGRIARADGKLVDYAIVRLPDGQTMMTFLDVTESANYQRVLKERNDALITADRLKDAFVQNVSYELRSPLTNIIGFADLLASGTAGELSDKQRTYTDYIRASSVTLGVLIDNILDLATVDAGIAELQPELQDVHALVEKARAGLAATFPDVDGEKAINLNVHIQPDLPPFIADGTRIVQVLYNLLSSAVRFSEPGGQVTLSVTARAERMLFVVEDEGAAMTEEMRSAMLERMDSPAISGRQRGAGLGLAIVRAFVNLHGGTIDVERRAPRGSRVTVSLPRDVAMAGVAE